MKVVGKNLLFLTDFHAKTTQTTGTSNEAEIRR